MLFAFVEFAQTNSAVPGALILAGAVVIGLPIAFTIGHVRMKRGRPIEFFDPTGRVQRGTVASHTWGSMSVRVQNEDGQEYDVRVRRVKPL